MEMTSRGADVASTSDYTYAMTVTASINTVRSALSDDSEIAEWWPIFSQHKRVGDEFHFVMGDMGPLVFSVSAKADAMTIEWHVSQCAVLPDWVGTTPTFEFHEIGDAGTQVTFQHVGLNPEVECFEQCFVGWNKYMPSLFAYLQASIGDSK